MTKITKSFPFILLIDVKSKGNLQKIKNLKEVLLLKEKTSDNLSGKNHYKMLNNDKICKFIKSCSRASLRNCIARHLKKYNLENTQSYSLEISKIFRKLLIIMKIVFFHKIVIEVLDQIEAIKTA